MMKYVALALALASVAAASELKESPRFGYISLDPDNGATLSFNSTTVTNGIFYSIVLFVVALAVKVFVGYDFLSLFEKREEQGYIYDPTQAYTNPTAFAKKSLDMMYPVLGALSKAYSKYE